MGQEAWTMQRVQEWLDKREQKVIRIRVNGGTEKAEGVCQGVDEVDACSTTVLECRLVMPIAGMDLHLSLHQETLAMHLCVKAQPESPSIVCLHSSIPYDRLILEDPAQAQQAPTSVAVSSPEIVTWSPYELLH